MDKGAMMQSGIFEILKGLREQLLHLDHASIVIGVVMVVSPGMTGQGGGQWRAFNGGRGRKLNFEPQTRSVLSDFLRPPSATPIQLAHSINHGGGRVRTLSKG